MNEVSIILMCLVFMVAGFIGGLLYALKRVARLNRIDLPDTGTIFIEE